MKKVKVSALVKKPLFRYLSVGSITFVSEYSSFYLFYTHFNLPLYVTNSASFCLALLISFILNKLWTFSFAAYKRKVTFQFGSYVSLALINLFLTNLFVELLKYMGVNPKIGKLVAMAITSIWNFSIFKFFVFAHRDAKLGQSN